MHLTSNFITFVSSTLLIPLSVLLTFIANYTVGYNNAKLPSITYYSPVPAAGTYYTGNNAKLENFDKYFYYLGDADAQNNYVPYPICKDNIRETKDEFFQKNGTFSLISDGYRCLSIVSFTPR